MPKKPYDVDQFLQQEDQETIEPIDLQIFTDKKIEEPVKAVKSPQQRVFISPQLN